MRNSSKFFGFLMLSLLMIGCIVLNCFTISYSLQNGSSPVFGIFAIIMCAIALILDIIAMIDAL